MKVTFVITLGERGGDPEVDLNRTLNMSSYDKLPSSAKEGFKGVYTDDYYDRKTRVNGVQYWVDTDLHKHGREAGTFNNSLSLTIESVRDTKLEEILR